MAPTSNNRVWVASKARTQQGTLSIHSHQIHFCACFHLCLSLDLGICFSFQHFSGRGVAGGRKKKKKLTRPLLPDSLTLGHLRQNISNIVCVYFPNHGWVFTGQGRVGRASEPLRPSSEFQRSLCRIIVLSTQSFFFFFLFSYLHLLKLTS